MFMSNFIWIYWHRVSAFVCVEQRFKKPALWSLALVPWVVHHPQMRSSRAFIGYHYKHHNHYISLHILKISTIIKIISLQSLYYHHYCCHHGQRRHQHHHHLLVDQQNTKIISLTKTKIREKNLFFQSAMMMLWCWNEQVQLHMAAISQIELNFFGGFGKVEECAPYDCDIADGTKLFFANLTNRWHNPMCSVLAKPLARLSFLDLFHGRVLIRPHSKMTASKGETWIF